MLKAIGLFRCVMEVFANLYIFVDLSVFDDFCWNLCMASAPYMEIRQLVKGSKQLYKRHHLSCSDKEINE